MRNKVLFAVPLALLMLAAPATAQNSGCEGVELPYYEDFYSTTGTLPECWDYDANYIDWNNWPETSGDGELFFRANSAGSPAVLPPFAANAISKLEITFKTKCGTIAEGDAILIGVADADGNLIQWIDTITDPNHSRNAWVWHTYNFLSYSGSGERIALGRLWNTTGDHWVAIDEISVRELPSCYPPEDLTANDLFDPDAISFSWTTSIDPEGWQVYVDTITTDIETVDESLLQMVSEPYYAIPEGVLQGGGKYAIHVRSVCFDDEHSNWVSSEFGAGTVVMNNTGVADIVTACGLVVYDNGGPIAGYQDNSNSLLTIYPEGIGNQLEVFGGAFGFGSTGASLIIYDGASTAGTQLYSYNTTDGRDTINSTLATSTQGALTIAFTSTGNMAHTGYELYVRCTSEPSCQRPTALAVVMQGSTQANLSWSGTAANYTVYYRKADAATWQSLSTTTTSATLTGLEEGSTYEAYVRSVCSATDSSIASVTLTFEASDQANPNCHAVTDVTVTNVIDNSATIQWQSDGNRWEVEYAGQSIVSTQNTLSLSGLTANTSYSVRVRTLCSVGASEWSNAVQFTTTNVGIETAEACNVMSVYPNPATDQVCIQTAEHGIVELLDVQGRTIGHWQHAGGRLVLSTGAVAPGTYLVRFSTDSGAYTQRLTIR